jgi:hypothetical protein
LLSTCPMHITPKTNSCFRFSLRERGKKMRPWISDRTRKVLRVSVDYLAGLLITKIIPGLKLARFPLVSFRASTVVLWDLAIESSVSPRCTL